MTAARRTRWNFGLQRAVELSREYRKPLLVLEALRSDYPFASDRFSKFIVDGIGANARALRRTRALYYPYVEPRPGAGAGLLETLAAPACVVVTDWFPAFFLPRMLATVAKRVRVRLESVDSNGLIPVAGHERAFPTARGYRAFMQRSLVDHLTQFPEENPTAALKGLPKLAQLPPEAVARWPAVQIDDLASRNICGGQDAAGRTLSSFLERKLRRYGDEHNDPDADCTSRLSPYLHFGHISAHEIFSRLMTHERWTTRKLGKVRAGAREGWWGVSASAENFLDQIIVWRELAFNGCAWTADFHSYETLPAWARRTLDAHLDDPRPHLYSLEQLDAAETHDEIWNAAQRQLRQEGWFHGYMRMLWGKKILEWCRHPAEALERMEVLMNRHSLDGRDPVSYLNYGWVLGRYDRPWPEHAIFGTVRYMSSESARRKLRLREYLRKFGA